MSLLQEVIEQYGVSEKPKAPTAKTAKTSSVSFGSEWSEHLQEEFPDAENHEIPAILDSIRIAKMREAGVVPDHYISTTECKHCGPVPIWEGCPTEVEGCPWCFNRLKGLRIPRANENG